MLLTVNNLRTSSIAFQTDGLAFVSFTVPGSGNVTDKSITPSQFSALEQQLKDAATAGHVTWSVKDDTTSLSDGTATGGAGTVSDALSGPGAVSVATRTTRVTSTGVGDALTLANGTYIGQRKTIIMVVDGGSSVITPATPSGFATATLNAVYDWVEMEWTGAAWVPAGFGGTAAFA